VIKATLPCNFLDIFSPYDLNTRCVILYQFINIFENSLAAEGWSK
jgi:hypothetical protein